MRFGGNLFKSYLQHNFKLLLVSLLVFALGSMAGSLYCLFLPTESVEALKETVFGMQVPGNSEALQLFTSGIVFYLQIWIFLWLCGTGGPGMFFAPLFIGGRGFACGYTVAALFWLYEFRGLAAAAAGVLVPSLLVLPGLQVLFVLAMRHIRTASGMQDRMRRRHLFFTYTLSCIAILPLFFIAALYESHVAWRLILRLLS